MMRSAEANERALATLSEPLPDALFGSPLECIFADNFRHRVLCNLLDSVSGGKTLDRETVGVVLAFLRSDFSIHLADEEGSLFPMLRNRAVATDGFPAILDQIRMDRQLLDQLIQGLERLAAIPSKAVPTPKLRLLLQTFTAIERKHVTVENVVVLPLARLRLTASDLASLGEAMIARRGLGRSERVPH